MTNTRLTDPEILERRYPVKLLKFQLAENTGGRGLFNGGDGIDRHMKFRLVRNSMFVVTYHRMPCPCTKWGGGGGDSPVLPK